MYRVVIVDDELLVINSLKNRINWKEQGFEVVGEARNGIAAYDVIIELKPDIVFTDIRMAGMTGLELIQRINELSLNIIFVVISGYAEFAYAQKALNYGALGFCLKPFDENEIIKILKNAKTRLDKLRKAYETELLTLVEDISDEGRLSRHEVLERLGLGNEPGIKIISVVSIGTTGLVIPGELKSIYLRIGRNKYLYIIELSDGLDVNGQKLRQVIGLENVPENVIGIGISKIHDSFDTLKAAFEEANISAYRYFINSSKSTILEYADLLHPEAFDNAVKELRNALVLKDCSCIEKQLNLLDSLFLEGNYTIQNALKVYNNFMYLFDFGMEETEKHENNLESCEQLTSLFSNAHEMLTYLKELAVKNDNQKTSLPVEEAGNDTYKRIVKYLNENYYNDISVQSLAVKLQCNPNYISQMFKKECGETFTEYLTGIRVKHACTMLKTEDLPVYEVAERAGYKDYFHFAKMFKRVTGKTPTAFREGK